MSILIFLILLGLVVLLWEYILAGIAYLIIYPALLGLVLLIFPSTRVLGVVVLVGCLIYYGTKESIKDSNGRRDFISTAQEAGFSRREINRMIRTKKPNETWDDCIRQLDDTHSKHG